MNKVDEITRQINCLSEEICETENAQHQLKRTEEALVMHFHRKKKFFNSMQIYWRTGDMANRIADRILQLQREENKTMDCLAEQQTGVRRQILALEIKEDELYRARKKAWEEDE
ncbi:DUF3958 family protein [Listeria riparia]|nr:DUF3958 family protein [Listeria riparia]